jgi:hypothetical protein
MLGTLVLGVTFLLAAIAVMVVRSVKLHHPDLPDTGRQNALLQASELLISPPVTIAAQLPKPITRTEYRYPATDPIPEPAKGAVNAPAGDGERAKPTSTWPSQALQESALPPPPGPVKADTARADATHAAVVMGSAAGSPVSTATVVAPSRKRLHNFIPAGIEDGTARPAPGDALYGLTVRGALRVIDDADCPFALSATRSDGGRTRAQIRSARSQGASGATAGWFEAGDSPWPGWRLLKVAPTEVQVLDPQGNSVRLRVDAYRAEPAETLPSTKSANRNPTVAR